MGKPNTFEALKQLKDAAKHLMSDYLSGEIQENSPWYPLFEAITNAENALEPITIEIDGGIVQSVSNIPIGMKIVVRDFDVEGVEGESFLKQTDDGHDYIETVHVGSKDDKTAFRP